MIIFKNLKKEYCIKKLIILPLETILYLNEDEKEDLFASLNFLKFQIDQVIEKFYYYFLKTDIVELFRQTNMVKQRMMFNTTLGIIISNIDNPILLQEQLDELVVSHMKYGVKPDYIDIFIDSFIKALNDSFSGSNKERYVSLWSKLITLIMDYFRIKLSSFY